MASSSTDRILKDLVAETTKLTAIVTRGTENLSLSVAQCQDSVDESYRIQQSIRGVADSVQAQVDIAAGHAQAAENYANDAQNRVDDAQGFVGQCQSIARKLEKKITVATDLVNAAELHVRAAQQFADEARTQVVLATAQATKATDEADRATAAVDLCKAEIQKGEDIVARAGTIKFETQQIYDATVVLADKALDTLDEQTLAIRDEMSQLASTIKADQDQLELNVAAHVLPLSVSLIETQTLIAKYHAFT